MAQDLKREIKSKHHGIKGLFSTKELRDAIQDYRLRVNDLKADFLVLFSFLFSPKDILIMGVLQIHVTGDSRLVLVDVQATQRDSMRLMAEIRDKQNTALEGEFVIRIATKHAGAFFFLIKILPKVPSNTLIG